MAWCIARWGFHVNDREYWIRLDKLAGCGVRISKNSQQSNLNIWKTVIVSDPWSVLINQFANLKSVFLSSAAKWWLYSLNERRYVEQETT